MKVTKRHIILLQYFDVDWEVKRPFGTSYYPRDIHEIFYPDDNLDDLSEEDWENLKGEYCQLYSELPAALEKILANAKSDK